MSSYIQASLWKDEEQVPTEHFIECTHFDGRIEIVSTLDTNNPLWRDMSVHMARFVEKNTTPRCTIFNTSQESE